MGAADAQRGCRPSDISIRVHQHVLPDFPGGVPEYTATFRTECPCPMESVHVTCDGLDGGAVPPDPSLVEVDDEGLCVLKQPVVPGKPYRFKYAVATPVNFRVISGYAACGK
ncbi:hypothetical protein EJB05_27850, partial [Eragrostis curvula]